MLEVSFHRSCRTTTVRISETAEVKRLPLLYGEDRAWQILHERRAQRLFIDPWVRSGKSLKWICQQLVAEQNPELRRRKWG